MNPIDSLRLLYRQFPRRDEPLSHFSKTTAAIRKNLGLERADFLVRQNGVFQTLGAENPRPVSLPRTLLYRLMSSRRPQPVSVRLPEIPWTLFWPVVLEGECVACWALSSKKGAVRLGKDAKKIMELAADRTAWCLGERALWNGLENANRQNSLGWMSSAILHEIRNPLTALGALIQLFPQKRKDESFLDSFEKSAHKEINRLISLTGDHLHFLKVDSNHWEKVDLRKLLDHVVGLVRPLFHSQGVQLTLKFSKTGIFLGNPAQIESLLLNLIQNALEAVKIQGQVEVTSKTLRLKGADWIQIQVKDNGPGIPPKDFSSIFRPFFTSKNTGSGLGLAICQKVVENHLGKMEVKSLPGKGTRFTILLPARTK